MTNEELAKLIVLRTKEARPIDYKECLLACSTICSLFRWSETKEGLSFWVDIDHKLGPNVKEFICKYCIFDINFL